MTSRLLILLLVALIGLSAPKESHAAEQCSEILQDGVMRHVHDTHDSAFKEYIDAKYVDSSSQSADSNKIGGLSVSIPDIVGLGANSSASEKEDKRRRIENSLVRQLQTRDYDQILLLEGDKEIIAAWSKCIQGHGGQLALHFEKTGDSAGRHILFVMQYIKPAEGRFQDFEEITAPVAVRGAKVLSSENCFELHHRIYSGSPCTAELLLPSARRTVTFVVSGSPFNNSASLPARLTHTVTRDEEYPLDLGDSNINMQYCQHKLMDQPKSHTIALTPREVAAGWAFVPQSGKVDVHIDGNWTEKGSKEYCNGGTFTSVEPTRASYQYTYSNGSPYTLICRVEPSIKVSRDYWRADDEEVLPSDQAGLHKVTQSPIRKDRTDCPIG